MNNSVLMRHIWFGYPYEMPACQRWLLLPRWAEVFVAWSESVAFRPITGSEALTILAGVEMALRTLDCAWQA